MTRSFVLFVALGASCLALRGDSRKPWQYSIEERVAARTSSAVIASHATGRSAATSGVLSTGIR